MLEMGITHYAVLRSPDFPLISNMKQAAIRRNPFKDQVLRVYCAVKK